MAKAPAKELVFIIIIFLISFTIGLLPLILCCISSQCSSLSIGWKMVDKCYFLKYTKNMARLASCGPTNLSSGSLSKLQGTGMATIQNQNKASHPTSAVAPPPHGTARNCTNSRPKRSVSSQLKLAPPQICSDWPSSSASVQSTFGTVGG